MSGILDGLWVSDLAAELRGKGADQVIAGMQETILRVFAQLRVRANGFSKVLNEVARGRGGAQHAYNNIVNASGLRTDVGNRVETLKNRVGAHMAAEGQKHVGSTVLDAVAKAASRTIV